MINKIEIPTTIMQVIDMMYAEKSVDEELRIIKDEYLKNFFAMKTFELSQDANNSIEKCRKLLDGFLNSFQCGYGIDSEIEVCNELTGEINESCDCFEKDKVELHLNYKTIRAIEKAELITVLNLK